MADNEPLEDVYDVIRSRFGRKITAITSLEFDIGKRVISNIWKRIISGGEIYSYKFYQRFTPSFLLSY